MRQALIAFVLCATWPGAATAYVRASVEGSPNTYLYWSTRRLTYFVNDRGSADVPLRETLGAIKRSFFTWASPSCTDLTFVFGGTTSSSTTNLVLGKDDKPDGRNTLIWREDKWPPDGAPAGLVTPEMAAITILIYNNKTGEIVDADIDLNGYHFFWTATDDTTKIATDIQNVVTHEIGHLLGLAHAEDKEATMYASTPQAETKKRSLERDDIDGLCFIYPYSEPSPTGPGQQGPTVDVRGGCSVAGGGGSGCGAMLLLLLFAARSKRLRSARISGPEERRAALQSRALLAVLRRRPGS